MQTKTIKTRLYDVRETELLIASGVCPLLAKLLVARGVSSQDPREPVFKHLIHPEALLNNRNMAQHLAQAIGARQKILVIGDYDADGATATAVAVKGLRYMGAQVDFLVPNRFEYGYGLTPEIVALASRGKPDFILTVDNGIASVAGVAAANALGIKVLVTDHHLPAELTPAATCIVNPNQRGCDFPSKHLAGVGVIFYVLLALRAELRRNGVLAENDAANLSDLLDLVALGTVADLVKLDANNRILVQQGLRRIRAGKACVGLNAILQVAGRDAQRATAQDLGFYVGPRLNAAGRLDDMSLGIRCLLADSMREAMRYAQQLHALNVERRQIEGEMQLDASMMLDAAQVAKKFSISVYQSNWHQGVIGILASRIKAQFHRPVIAFAQAGDGLLKGSGRSISGLHLRDALDMVSKYWPDLIVKFGGHAMAAGLSIREHDFARFEQAFEEVVQSLISMDALQETIETDGALAVEEMTLDNAHMLEHQVWGQGFAPPLFVDTFEVLQQRVLGEKHLKLVVQKQQQWFEAIHFNLATPLPVQIQAVYQLQVNQFNGATSLQLQIHHVLSPDSTLQHA